MNVPPPPGTPGEYVIGVTPIGDQGFDWLATVISQYANSPILLNLIDLFNQNVDQTINIDNFYDWVWNIQTAQGWGLDVWGRIVGVSRVLPVTTRYLGFEEMGDADIDPFNVSPFYSGEPQVEQYALSDSAFRTLILAKALANICGGSVPAINKILQLLFPGRGNCYVTDPGGMKMVYVFQFALTPVEVAVITQSGVLPRPTGVAVSYSIT
jgi:hypothetical protein